MGEQLRENYFLAVRMGVLLVLELYIVVTQPEMAGASAGMLLLLALFFGSMIVKEFVKGKKRIFSFVLCLFFYIIIVAAFGRCFLLLGVPLAYEVISFTGFGIAWYIFPELISLIPSQVGFTERLLIVFFIGIIYVQNDLVVMVYKKQLKEENLNEQSLKRDINRRENELKEELKKNLLMTENRLLEERAQLSQALHDKLGHNINGSVYQLEAIKLLLRKEPETSERMIQAVINQLREGMDEIRAILRKERPRKHKLAMMQLEKLCEECREKGINANLVTEGELSQVPEKQLETILDNSYEAVSNSIKYSGCDKIEIKIHVMNKMVRCSISDNGVGCKEIVDGMGLAGMRRRMRDINGILDFESEVGFIINMLLPL